MKAIYIPKGKAGEYANYACNLYVGCSNNCDYCYCKKGVLAHAMGQDEPQLKKCFTDETDAFLAFRKECWKFRDVLQKVGYSLHSLPTRAFRKHSRYSQNAFKKH